MFLEYVNIFKFLILCLSFSLFLFFLSFFFVFQTPYFEKLSIYECGFNPWGDARSKFEVRFYLVGILFIIFDLEITYLFPWVLTGSHITIVSLIVAVIFVIILTVGFYMNGLKVLLIENNLLNVKESSSGTGSLFFYNLFFFSRFIFFSLYSVLFRWNFNFILKFRSLIFSVFFFSLFFVVVFFKFNSMFRLHILTDIVGIDRPFDLYNRFELGYIFWNIYFNFFVQAKVFVDLYSSLVSISSLYSSASWLEREVWDMFGVKFIFHRNLRRILTDYGFKGFPLRKDFPLTGFTELRYDDFYAFVKVEPLLFAQNFRFFRFLGSWSNWISYE